MNFFKKIHNVINFHMRKDSENSNINPAILNNFYDYAMLNERTSQTQSQSQSRHSKPSIKKNSVVNIINYNITNINLKLDGDKVIEDHDNEENPQDQVTMNQNIISQFNNRLQLKENMRRVSIEKNKFPKQRKSMAMQCTAFHIIPEENEDEIESGRINIKRKSDRGRIQKRLTKIQNQLNENNNKSAFPKKEIRFCFCSEKKNKELGNFNTEGELKPNPQGLPKRFSLISKEVLQNVNTQDNLLNQPPSKNFNQNAFDFNSRRNNRFVTRKPCCNCGGIVINNPFLEENIEMSPFGEQSSIMVDEDEFYHRASITPLIVSSPFFNTTPNKEKSKTTWGASAHTIKPTLRKRVSSISIKQKREQYFSNLENPGMKEESESRKNTLISDMKEKEIHAPSVIVKINTMKENDEEENVIEDPVLDENIAVKLNSFQKLSSLLAKKTTIRLICLILIILFVFPYLDSDKYIQFDDKNSYHFELKFLENLLEVGKEDYFLMKLEYMILNDSYRHDNTQNILKFGFHSNETMCLFPKVCERFNRNSTIYSDLPHYDNARAGDRVMISLTYLYVIYSIKEINHLESILQCSKITYVAILLFTGAFFFLKDINQYVIIPIEDSFEKMSEANLLIMNENIYCDIEEILKYDEDLRKIIPQKDPESFDYFFLQSAKMIVQTSGMRVFNYYQKYIMKNIQDYHEDANSQKNHNHSETIIPQSKLSVFPIENPFFSLNGVYILVDVVNFNELCTQFSTDICSVYSRILNIIELTVFEYFGEVLKIDQNKILLFWDEGKCYKKQTSYSLIKNSNSSKISKSSSEQTIRSDNSHNSPNSDSSSSEEEVLSSNDDKNIKNVPQMQKNIRDYLNDNQVQEPNHPENLIDALLPKIKKSILFPQASNLAVLCSIKMLSRIYNDYFLSDKFNFQKIRRSDTKTVLRNLWDRLKISIAINNGKIYNMIARTNNLIESMYIGKCLIKLKKLSEQNRILNTKIVFSRHVFEGLAQSFVKFTRDLSSLCGMTIFNFDIDFCEKPLIKNPYFSQNFKLNISNALFLRKEFAETVNSGMFDLDQYIRLDPELIFAQVKDVTFLDFFREGLFFYEGGNYREATRSFKNALMYKPDDSLTCLLMKKIQEDNIK